MALTRYNAKDCTITIDGTYITGLGEDMVSGEKDEDFFTPVVGAQGDIIESTINDTLGEVTVIVQVTSPQKAFLLSLANREAAFPLWVTNKSLGERFGGTQAKLLKYPEMARGAEAEDMEFVFKVFDYVVEAA